ncbi:hypothetical protein CCUS01_10064 [Colletotrichum cuscutae]|uniref:Uncharacterized protein n=1 Tax=Colletotrichum cuscutae TaxID=1209917 RepID=A0AAI9UDG5_9PEZI|nr:hypothetical protein CCUS01_10064 [Colletotrichum cuscutae]
MWEFAAESPSNNWCCGIEGRSRYPSHVDTGSSCTANCCLQPEMDFGRLVEKLALKGVSQPHRVCYCWFHRADNLVIGSARVERLFDTPQYIPSLFWQNANASDLETLKNDLVRPFSSYLIQAVVSCGRFLFARNVDLGLGKAKSCDVPALLKSHEINPPHVQKQTGTARANKDIRERCRLGSNDIGEDRREAGTSLTMIDATREARPSTTISVGRRKLRLTGRGHCHIMAPLVREWSTGKRVWNKRRRKNYSAQARMPIHSAETGGGDEPKEKTASMRMPLCSFFFSFPHSLFSLRGVLLLPLSLSVGFCSRCSSALTDPSRLDVSPVWRKFETLSFSLFALCDVSFESESVPIETLVLAIGVSFEAEWAAPVLNCISPGFLRPRHARRGAEHLPAPAEWMDFRLPNTMEPTVVSAADPVSGLHFRLFLCNQQGQTLGQSSVVTIASQRLQRPLQLHTLLIGWLSCLLSGQEIAMKDPMRATTNVRHVTKRPRQPTTMRAAATPQIWLPNRLFFRYNLCFSTFHCNAPRSRDLGMPSWFSPPLTMRIQPDPQIKADEHMLGTPDLLCRLWIWTGQKMKKNPSHERGKENISFGSSNKMIGPRFSLRSAPVTGCTPGRTVGPPLGAPVKGTCRLSETPCLLKKALTAFNHPAAPGEIPIKSAHEQPIIPAVAESRRPHGVKRQTFDIHLEQICRSTNSAISQVKAPVESKALHARASGNHPLTVSYQISSSEANGCVKMHKIGLPTQALTTRNTKFCSNGQPTRDSTRQAIANAIPYRPFPSASCYVSMLNIVSILWSGTTVSIPQAAARATMLHVISPFQRCVRPEEEHNDPFLCRFLRSAEHSALNKTGCNALACDRVRTGGESFRIVLVNSARTSFLVESYMKRLRMHAPVITEDVPLLYPGAELWMYPPGEDEHRQLQPEADYVGLGLTILGKEIPYEERLLAEMQLGGHSAVEILNELSVETIRPCPHRILAEVPGVERSVASSIGGNATHFAVKVVQKLPLAEMRTNDGGRSRRVAKEHLGTQESTVGTGGSYRYKGEEWKGASSPLTGTAPISSRGSKLHVLHPTGREAFSNVETGRPESSRENTLRYLRFFEENGRGTLRCQPSRSSEYLGRHLETSKCLAVPTFQVMLQEESRQAGAMAGQQE